jgi:hypothetical protein
MSRLSTFVKYVLEKRIVLFQIFRSTNSHTAMPVLATDSTSTLAAGVQEETKVDLKDVKDGEQQRRRRRRRRRRTTILV